MIKRWLNLLIYGGGTKLRHYEEHLLSLAEQVLPSPEQSVLRGQVRCLQRIKRYNDDRMVTFQFDGAAAPLFADTSPELVLVSYYRPTRKVSKPIALLISHRGRISSLEFKVKPATLDTTTWSEMSAAPGGANPQVAREIDQEEHQAGE